MLKRFAGTDERKAGWQRPCAQTSRETEEIGQTIVFLASDKASFITGVSYLVAGRKQPSDAPLGRNAGCRVRRTKNEQTIESKNKALVLEASIRCLISGTTQRLSAIGRPTISSTALISGQAVKAWSISSRAFRRR